LGGHKWGDHPEHDGHPQLENLQWGERYFIDAVTHKAVKIRHHPHGNHDFFRVVKLPNCTVAQLETMLAPERDQDPRRPSPYLQFRLNYFDRSKILAEAFAKHWDDHLRDEQFIVVPLVWAQLKNFVSQRKPVPF
jgi:hypothetical protein